MKLAGARVRNALWVPTPRDRAPNSEFVPTRRPDFFQRSGNARRPVKRARQLPGHGPSRVRVLAEVRREQNRTFKVRRASNAPDSGFQRVCHISTGMDSDLGFPRQELFRTVSILPSDKRSRATTAHRPTGRSFLIEEVIHRDRNTLLVRPYWWRRVRCRQC